MLTREEKNTIFYQKIKNLETLISDPENKLHNLLKNYTNMSVYEVSFDVTLILTGDLPIILKYAKNKEDRQAVRNLILKILSISYKFDYHPERIFFINILIVILKKLSEDSNIFISKASQKFYCKLIKDILVYYPSPVIDYNYNIFLKNIYDKYII